VAAAARDDEVRRAPPRDLGDRRGDVAERRPDPDLGVEAGRLEVGDLELDLQLQLILVGVHGLAAAASGHQLVDVRDDDLRPAFSGQ